MMKIALWMFNSATWKDGQFGGPLAAFPALPRTNQEDGGHWSHQILWIFYHCSWSTVTSYVLFFVMSIKVIDRLACIGVFHSSY